MIVSALESRLRSRLATLTEERQRFLDQAQRTLAMYDGAVAELRTLLEPPAEPEPEPVAMEADGHADPAVIASG